MENKYDIFKSNPTLREGTFSPQAMEKYFPYGAKVWVFNPDTKSHIPPKKEDIIEAYVTDDGEYRCGFRGANLDYLYMRLTYFDGAEISDFQGDLIFRTREEAELYVERRNEKKDFKFDFFSPKNFVSLANNEPHQISDK